LESTNRRSLIGVIFRKRREKTSGTLPYFIYLILSSEFGGKGDRISKDGLRDGVTRLRAEALQCVGTEMGEAR
jgi:hypothetical protein